MRKIIITFVVAVTLVIGGALVFVMEANQIKVVTETISSESTTTKKRLDGNVKYLIFGGNLYDESGIGTHYLNLVEIEKDQRLGPNDIVIEHNKKFKVKINDMSDDEAELTFVSKYSYIDLNGNGTSIEEMLKTWKTKTYNEKDFDEKFFEIKIKHGANVKVLDTNSDEYTKYRIRKSENAEAEIRDDIYFEEYIEEDLDA